MESEYFPKYLEFLEVATSCKLVLLSNQSLILSELIKSGSLNFGMRLKVALELTKALEIFQGFGFIHKDIKPENILIKMEGNEIKSVQLFDFSLSAKNSKELLPFSPTGSMEGTFHYMSPEQTGRMNRVIDYRTVFYSLGSSLYELFSGKKLFPYSEPIKLVHAHLDLNPDYSKKWNLCIQ